MGVPQFLKEILATAGRKIDLRYYQSGILINDAPQQRRPLRIAVDVSSWIYKACQGRSEMLGDENHLSNYGRAVMLETEDEEDANVATSSSSNNGKDRKEVVLKYIQVCSGDVMKRLISLKGSTDADILVVFDGATPPVKYEEVASRSRKRRRAEEEREDATVNVTADDVLQENRIKSFRQAGAGKHYFAVISHLIQLLRENNYPFLVAPYEADGQLAYLSNRGYVDLIITEDSDLVAYGASPILYKVSEWIGTGVPAGILLRREDLCANDNKLNLQDFSPAMLAAMFVAVGSDYCPKLKGIGVAVACEMVRESFFRRGTDGHHPPALDVFFDKLFRQTWDRSEITTEFRENFEKRFLEGLFTYQHPVVYDPIEKTCRYHGDVERGDPELMTHPAYAELCSKAAKRDAIVGPFLEPSLATYIAQGWISAKTLEPLMADHVVSLPEVVRKYLKSRNLQAKALIENRNSQQLESRPPRIFNQKVHEYIDSSTDDEGPFVKPSFGSRPGRKTHAIPMADEPLPETKEEGRGESSVQHGLEIHSVLSVTSDASCENAALLQTQAN